MEPHSQGGAWCTGPSHSHSTAHRHKHIEHIAHTCVPSLAHSTPMCMLRLMLRVVCSVPSAGAPISGALTADRVSMVGLEPYWIGVGTQTASSQAAQGVQFSVQLLDLSPVASIALCAGRSRRTLQTRQCGLRAEQGTNGIRRGEGSSRRLWGLAGVHNSSGSVCGSTRSMGGLWGTVSQAAESVVVLNHFPLLPGPCQGSQEETGEGLSAHGIPGCGHLHGRACLQAKGSGASKYGTFPQGK